MRGDPAEVSHRDGEDDDRVGPLLLDEPLEMASPPWGDDLPDRLPRQPIERALLGVVLCPPEVPVTFDAGQPVAKERVGLAFPIGRIGSGAPPRALDRPATVGGDDQIGAGLVHPLPQLPPGRGAAVLEVEVDSGGNGQDAGRSHGLSV